MKKLFFLLAFAGLATFANAQTSVPVEKYSVSTNSFWSNWFITAGGDYTVFYSDQQHGLGLNNNPLKDFRRSWGFGVGVGKWFTPGIGLRTKFNGINGKSVVSELCHENKGMKNYWNLNEQVLFNLSNLFCGYSDTRVWNFIPYVGGGVVRNMTADIYGLDWQAGVMNTWRLGKKLDLFLDLSWTMAEPKVDGVNVRGNDPALKYKNYDGIATAEVGLKFNLGKATWAKTPDVDALMAMNKEQLDALNASLRDAQNENARLKALLAQKKDPAPAQTIIKKELATTKQSVFFNIGKYRIASRKDLVNVKEVADYAKANGNKIVVTGYADSKTGTPAFNQTLSQRRAETVANELVKMGISRDNIEVKAAGGVNDLSPISYNRRATVEIK